MGETMCDFLVKNCLNTAKEKFNDSSTTISRMSSNFLVQDLH